MSLLASYSYRYHLQTKPSGGINQVCQKIVECEFKNKNLSDQMKFKLGQYLGNHHTNIAMKKFDISVGHEICDLPQEIIPRNLKCAFKVKTPPREFIMLRYIQIFLLYLI